MSATVGPISASEPGAAARRLPSTVYILAGLLLLKAASIASVIVGASVEPLRQLALSTVGLELTEALRGAPAAFAILGLLVLALFFAGIALLRRRRIGWLLAMVLTGIFVAIDIYGFLTTGANHAWMLLNLVTVFYLNQREVREAVGAAGRDGPDEVVA